MTIREKAYDIVIMILKIVFGLTIGFFILRTGVFIISGIASDVNSRSDGYKLAEKIVKSEKLIGMTYNDVIDVLNEYHGECEDFGGGVYETDGHDSDGSFSHYIKCKGGSANTPYGTFSEYTFQVKFDRDGYVKSVSHYCMP
ncbi:MAG: hypothetical protein J1F11_05130 [Oscillospiraceae bacterium]|nr:hypothetical protein [Oscillospiraceae bacterium]